MKSIQEIGRKTGDTMRRHPWLTAAAMTSILDLAVLEVVGYAQNPTYDIPEDACISPPAVSRAYDGDPLAHPLQWYSGVLTTGVLASGNLPAGAYGVQASFKHPEEDSNVLQANASDMLHADVAGHFALKMARGNGDVEFAVSVVAPEGSALCNAVPDVRYDPLSKTDYLTAGDLPWPNPSNVVFNVFA